MTAQSRTEIALAAADALDAARPRLTDAHTFAGFDGFVDSIIHLPATRTGPGRDDYIRMDSMRTLAERIEQASGKSANFELIVRRVRLGGNGPILAGALLALGAPVDYIGNLSANNSRGPVEDAAETHDVFHDFARRCRRLYTLGPPGFTDALEFNDGKLLLGKLDSLNCVTWTNIVEAVGGEEQLVDLVGDARLLIAANWTMLQEMGAIWEGLRERVLPRIKDGGRRKMFIDLADPAKRGDDDLNCAFEQLSRLNEVVDVTLGLNTAEAGRSMKLIGVDASSSEARLSMDNAEQLRAAIGLTSVVIHNPRGVVGSDGADRSDFESPFIRAPKISTGAGDHFNAGFSFGLALGLPIDQCMASGAATSGWYVRTGHSPDLKTLIEFLRDLPAPE